jgi:hypothetical protein
MAEEGLKSGGGDTVLAPSERWVFAKFPSVNAAGVRRSSPEQERFGLH